MDRRQRAFARICAALYAVGSAMFACGAAQALPGERIGTIVAALHRKPFKIHESISEMSGMPMYNADATVAGAKIFYHLEDTPDHISFQELVRYEARGFAFARRRDARVRKVMAAMFDDSVARDFLDASVVAIVPLYRSALDVTFLRGARFAYGAVGDRLTVYRRKELAAQIVIAKRCATMECGD